MAQVRSTAAPMVVHGARRPVRRRRRTGADRMGGDSSRLAPSAELGSKGRWP